MQELISPLEAVSNMIYTKSDNTQSSCQPNLFNIPKQNQDFLNHKKGTTTLGFVIKSGLIIAVDSRSSMGTYVASQLVRKVIEINDYLLGTMAGGAADCAFWERELARLCKLYELRNKERISVAAASNLLSNIFYQYKGYGLSCGTMIAGWNPATSKSEIYYVSDDGSRILGNLFSIGSGSTFAYGILDSEYSENLELSKAVALAKKAIYHATHRDGGSGGLVRVYYVHEKGWEIIEEGLDINKIQY